MIKFCCCVNCYFVLTSLSNGAHNCTVHAHIIQHVHVHCTEYTLYIVHVQYTCTCTICYNIHVPHKCNTKNITGAAKIIIIFKLHNESEIPAIYII